MNWPDKDGPQTPQDAVLRMLSGKWVVAAMAAAANVGLPDALAQGPKTAAQLADELDCHAPNLERIMRVLVGEGLLDELSGGVFALTETGRHLQDDSLGPLVRYITSMAQWAPWANLDHSLRTGKSAFTRTHGVDLYTYVTDHPEHAALYNRGVDHFTREQAAKLAELELFATTRHVVDVGGGRGAVLTALLARWPELRGTLFDLPHVVASPHERLAEGGDLAARASLVGGDFRVAVPSGADCYVIKHVLHNWDDAMCLRILEHCAESLAPGGRVLVVEGIVLAGVSQDRTRLLDLEMMVVTEGGRERRKPEFRKLFKKAGLKMGTVTRLTPAAYCLEATLAG